MDSVEVDLPRIEVELQSCVAFYRGGRVSLNRWLFAAVWRDPSFQYVYAFFDAHPWATP